MIPKILHYCFGMSSDFGGKPWGLIHYVCLRSAVERIRPAEVRFYCEHEPAGPWWELSRALVAVHAVKAPREVFGNPLPHVAHRADVLRLEVLRRDGGIYLDADVFVHRSFDDLLSNATVMGEQRAGRESLGLCNAVILSEAQSPFLSRWYSEYKSFRSLGHDKYWDEHSVKLPYQLSKEHPDEISVLPHTSFFWPTFMEEDIAKIYASSNPIDVSTAYATHLWESPAWGRYLEHLTPRQVRAVDSNFHYWARPLIETLPDDYGAPSVAVRVVGGVQRAARRIRRSISHAKVKGKSQSG